MSRTDLDDVIGNPPCQGSRSIWRDKRFARPDLRLWSINLLEETELTGQRRHDAEREARISQLDQLIQSDAATPLWRRVCKHVMYSEIRSRSVDQQLVVELAILESAR